MQLHAGRGASRTMLHCTAPGTNGGAAYRGLHGALCRGASGTTHCAAGACRRTQQHVGSALLGCLHASTCFVRPPPGNWRLLVRAHAPVHTHMYTHKYTYVRMLACTHTHARTHTCVRAHTNAQFPTHTHMRTHTHTQMCKSTYRSAHRHTHPHPHPHPHTNTHTHMNEHIQTSTRTHAPPVLRVREVTGAEVFGKLHGARGHHRDDVDHPLVLAHLRARRQQRAAFSAELHGACGHQRDDVSTPLAGQTFVHAQRACALAHAHTHTHGAAQCAQAELRR